VWIDHLQKHRVQANYGVAWSGKNSDKADKTDQRDTMVLHHSLLAVAKGGTLRNMERQAVVTHAKTQDAQE